MEITITEAARRLGISERTVRRRLHTGELAGRQVATPQGFVWTVDMPDDMTGDQTNGKASDGESGVLREMVEILKDEVATLKGELSERGQEVQQLHVLLQQAQAALPAPKEFTRPWWKLW